MNELVQKTLERMRAELVAALTAAIRIPSINPAYPGERYEEHVGAEGQVSRLLSELYAAAGAEVDVFGLAPGRENCVGTIRGSGGGRSLILNGHVDVVPGGPSEDWFDGDPWSGRVADGYVWGRGASDMKGGLLAQAFAARALKEAGVRLRGDLILEAVVGEETMEHELGTTACVKRGYRADAAVVAEPSAPPVPLAVVPITPGVLHFIITIEGKRTHPAMRGSTIHAGGQGWDAGVNAIDKGFLIYQALRLREAEWGLTKRHPLFQPGQFVIQPGVMVGAPRGQLDPFFIPDEARLDYIVIYHPDEPVGEVEAEIEELIADAARMDGWLRMHPPTVEWKHHWPPSILPAEHAIVSETCAAHEQATGRPAAVVGWSAVHDGTFLNAAGIPTICYGPGNVQVAHATDERVSIDELIAAASTYALLAIRWCDLA